MPNEFYYFGYGSNMSPVALAAKGVSPLSREPAILSDWRLVFDIPDFFSIEGGTGNIRRESGSKVHGVVYKCRAEDRKRLDELEALGVTYDRIEAEVVTYTGTTVTANIYVGIPGRLAPGLAPSRRYLDILIRGAREMALASEYVRWLEKITTHRGPVYDMFAAPNTDRVFTLESLAREPVYTSLAGHVFDMSNARAEHAYLQRLLGASDVTVFFLRRMSTSDGTETLADFVDGRLGAHQQRYLNDYLHEFAREYEPVGSIDYVGVSGAAATGKLTLRHNPGELPARRALEEATRTNFELGNENAGFLSESHGFMPQRPPIQNLPPKFAAWDELATSLPEHYAALSLRRAVDALPVLSAAPAKLPEAYLLRAASVLAMLSHAYHYVETGTPSHFPEALAKPWEQVRQRLARDQPVLSYIDLIVYNWGLRDPNRADRMRLENMFLLIPTVNTKPEQIFYLTQAEILAQCSPIIGAVVRAQEAVRADDQDLLAIELRAIIRCLQRVVRESLFKINPNPYGPNFVEPVVWARTVAPFAVPMQAGLLGPSGTSSPVFNLLDSFLGRTKHKSFLGKEIRALRQTYPRHWRRFLEAVEEVSVSDYVAERGTAKLRGLLKEAADVYAGESGFLGRHRMKVYGYLELAFKVGRSVTIGGFSGMFQERTWDQVDTELEYSRVERTQSFPRGSHVGTITAVHAPQGTEVEGVRQINIDVAGTGVRCVPGDRCAILPENDEELVERTLDALGATGNESVPLSPEWLAAVKHRPGYDSPDSLRLRDFLRFAKIRPVLPRVAEALHAASQDEVLRHAIKNQTVIRWELWDLLLLLKKRGYSPVRLLTAEPGSPEHLCRVVPPESFRMYSVSGVTAGPSGIIDELSLTVGRLRYSSDDDPAHVERRGTASNFLTSASPGKTQVAFYVEHPPRFSLPTDPSIPIVMVAGGTGISPFRSFIIERRSAATATDWLLLANRSRDYFYYADDMAASMAAGQLELGVAFSRDDADVVFHPDGEGSGHFEFTAGKARHIEELLLDEGNAHRMWTLLRSRSEGGQGAYVYVCGRARFSRSVQTAMAQIFERFADGADDSERQKSARDAIRRLVAEGRYAQEVFTDAPAGNLSRPKLRVSQVTEMNSDETAYWTVIDGLVYDVTEFLHHHPGGLKALRGYTGMDASQGFQRVHAAQSEVRAMLEIYEIGLLAHPNFERVGVEVVRGDVTQRYSLAALYSGWADALYLVVEMQNALRSDQSLQFSPTAADDPIAPRSLYKLQRSIETHERFLRSYVDGLTQSTLPDLWAATQRMCASHRDPQWMSSVLSAVEASDGAVVVDGVLSSLHAEISACTQRADSRERIDRIRRACEHLEKNDRELLVRVKQALREGILLFEEHQAGTLDHAAAKLMSCLSQLPSLVESYYESCAIGLLDDHWTPGKPTDRRAAIEDDRKHLKELVSTSHYTMEQDADRQLVILTRNANTLDSLEGLIEQNDELIAQMRSEHADYGIVVDMRQAPARNDPDFEQAMARLRGQIFDTYARVAVLLMSAAGVLQVNRLGRDEGAEQFATLSKAAAIRFAQGKLTGEPGERS